MKVIFVRHGKAINQGTLPDRDRHLTEEGVTAWQKTAQKLRDYLIMHQLNYRIYSSDLLRAEQTAKVLAELLPLNQVDYQTFLATGEIDPLIRLIEEHPDQVPILIGHEPYISEWLQALTGKTYKVKKGSYAVLDWHKGKVIEAKRIKRIK